MLQDIENLIKKLTSAKQVSFKQHCVERMIERDITTRELLYALKNPEIIKVYPEDRPLTSYLVLGFNKSKKPLHIVLAVSIDRTRLWIITVYRPDNQKWSNDFKERRK